MEIKEISNEEFNEFSEKYILNSMYQTTEYGLVMNKQNYTTMFVGLINDINEVVAASLILIEKFGQFKYAYAPRGFLIDYTNKELLTEFTTKIKKFLKKKRVMAIKICPLVAKSKYTPSLNITLDNPSYDVVYENLKNLKYYHLGYNNFFEALKPRFVAIANLETDTNKMFNNLDNNLKNIIRSCDLAGLRIYKGSDKNLDFLYEELREKRERSKEYVNDLYYFFSRNNKAQVYFVQLESKVFLVNTQKEYQKQINICNNITDEVFKNQGKADNELIQRKIKEDNKLASIKQQLVYATNILKNNPNGVIVASAMVIINHGQVYLTLDGYNEQYKHLCPKHLLIWKLMEKFAKEGYKELNLGGISNPKYEGENEFENLNKFKLSFNSSCIEYGGDFELITSIPLYALYRNGAPIRKIFGKKQQHP